MQATMMIDTRRQLTAPSPLILAATHNDEQKKSQSRNGDSAGRCRSDNVVNVVPVDEHEGHRDVCKMKPSTVGSNAPGGTLARGAERGS